MEILIKDSLRELRHKKGVTQEQLADHLGISQQSVGKWERGEGFPDITLLPAIAMYFDTTVDDLLGVGEAKINKKISEYIIESRKLNNLGNVKQDLILWEKAYKEFPNNHRVALNLMYALSHDNSIEQLKKLIELGEMILNTSNDVHIREGAIQLLCYASSDLGNIENAKKYAQMTGDYFTTRDELMKSVLKGEEAVTWCQKNISSLAVLITGNANIMSRKGNYTSEEKIQIYQFCINIYKLIYENEDFGFYTSSLSRYYNNIAYEYANLKNVDACLDMLENMVKFAVISDTQLDMKHTSLFVDHIDFKQGSIIKNYIENESRLRLKYLGEKQYDFLRDNPRFIEVVNALEKFAN